ncbi:MAG: cupin domain-containing protein [Emcibacteraceae bacterium]
MTEIKAADIESELSKLKMLEGRDENTPVEVSAAAFAKLASFDTGGVFTGSFSGDSPWERHNAGDELVHILKGEADLSILTRDGPEVLNMKAGMLTVVPKGLWHRFHAPNGVTVLTATPQPTDHSTAELPKN